MNYDTRTKHFIKEVRILSQIVDLRLTKTAGKQKQSLKPLLGN